MNIRTDSKSIALLAVFTSLVIALEIFPIPGVTDLYTPVPNFTIDWTGIPIMIVFLGLGGVFSVFTVGVMWVFIAYRNFQGAAFKGFAETFTLLGLIVAKIILRNRDLDWKKSAVIYLIFACLFRGVGMLFGNVVLFNLFWGWSYDTAFTISMIYVPWNIIQAAVNVLGGLFLYQLIPESLRIQAGLGLTKSRETTVYEEISEDELKTGTE
jgi:riboflavin transporter FmnP